MSIKSINYLYIHKLLTFELFGGHTFLVYFHCKNFDYLTATCFFSNYTCNKSLITYLHVTFVSFQSESERFGPGHGLDSDYSELGPQSEAGPGHTSPGLPSHAPSPSPGPQPGARGTGRKRGRPKGSGTGRGRASKAASPNQSPKPVHNSTNFLSCMQSF